MTIARIPLLLSAACSVIAAVVLAVATLSSQQADSAQILNQEELNFLALINQYRASQGLGPLVLHDDLNDAARWLSEDFADKDYISHTDSLNRDMTTRLKAFANPWPFIGWAENVAAGYPTAEGAFNGWKNSAGHNKNMLGDYNVIGIAMTCKAGTTYGCYWATDFGKTPGPPPPTTTPQGATPTPTNSPTPTPTPTPSPTASPTASPSPSPTPTGPTASPSPSPSATPNPDTIPAPGDDANALLKPLDPGDHQLDLGTSGSTGLQAGDIVIINPGGPNEEIHTIAGVGPLRTDDGMQFSHAAGELVVKIQSGDVNCDQQVNALDAALMMEHFASVNGNIVCIDIGDTDCNDAIDGNDPLNVLRRGAQLPRNTAPGDCPPVGGGSPANTNLRSPASAGDESLDIDSNAGFDVGDTIRLNKGADNEEEFVIQDFGSFIVSELRFDHEAGEPIEKVLTVPFTPEEGTPTPTPTPVGTDTPPPETPTPTPGAETPTPTLTPTITPTPNFCDEVTPTLPPEETQTPTPTPCVPAPTPTPTETVLPTCTPEEETQGSQVEPQGPPESETPAFTPSPPPTPSPSPTPCATV